MAGINTGDALKYIRAGVAALEVLSNNGISPRQLMGVVKGLEPILADLGVDVPTEVNDALVALDALLPSQPKDSTPISTRR